MTGVQLEISDYATPFEHRSFAQELDLCKRYYFRNTSVVAYARFAIGQSVNSGGSHHRIQYPVAMRVAPTFGSGGNSCG